MKILLVVAVATADFIVLSLLEKNNKIHPYFVSSDPHEIVRMIEMF